MAGYVIGSMAHYKFLKGRLIDISNKLKSSEIDFEERVTLMHNQCEIVDKLEQYFPDGKPK